MGGEQAGSVGRRMAALRKKRGLTQVQLATKLGKSVAWVSSIESGRRQLQKLDMINQVADALNVQPSSIAEESSGDGLLSRASNDIVGKVRHVLSSPGHASEALFGGSLGSSRKIPEVVSSAERVLNNMLDYGWSRFQFGKLDASLTSLPELLEWVVNPHIARSFPVETSRAYHLASGVLLKIRENDLALICAEKSIQNSAGSESFLAKTTSARTLMNALTAQGLAGQALQLADDAVSFAGSECDFEDPVHQTMLGMVHLQAAVCSGHEGHESVYRSHLNRAQQIVLDDRVPENIWHTGFGRGNLVAHHIAAEAALGHHHRILEIQRLSFIDFLPPERKATASLELGHAAVMVGNDVEASSNYLRAIETSAELVMADTEAVGNLRKLLNRQGHTMGKIKFQRVLETVDKSSG